MAPFDGPYTTFYWPNSTNIALSCTISELFEISVRGHIRSFNLVPFESLGAATYSPSIVTMALCCIVSEIKRDIGGKSSFFHTPLHSTPPLGGPSRNSAMTFSREKPEWLGYPMVEKFVRHSMTT